MSTYPKATVSYRGVPMRALSITQTMVYWQGKEFLADGHLAAMALIDSLIAAQEF